MRAVLGLLRGLLGWRVLARPPDSPLVPGRPLLVVFNHTSMVDAFFVADTVWRRLRRWCSPLVKAELFDVPLFGTFAGAAGAIPVARGEGAGRETAYRDAIARLREGATIMIAPEATITHDGTLLPMRHGAARMALEAGADVLVATHFGAQRAFSPVVRLPQRRVVVTMALDLISPTEDDDAPSLTGRIAATMLDRSAQLQATYPQADPGAPWWPPYATPASPTAIAKDNLERYQHSMAEAIANARARMAELTDRAELEERAVEAKQRAVAAAEDLAARSRSAAEHLAERTRERVEDLTAKAREHAPGSDGPDRDDHGDHPDEQAPPGDQQGQRSEGSTP